MKLFISILLSVLCCANSTRMHGCRRSTSQFGPYLQQVTEPFEHSEGPTWDWKQGLLYIVDIHKGLVISLNPETKAVKSVKLDGDVTPVIPTNTPNRFIVGLDKSMVLLEWNGQDKNPGNVTVLATVDENKIGNRFNDGKADERGRVWMGTMGFEDSNGVVPDQGTLYKFARVKSSTPKTVSTTSEISPVSISNGLAWSADNKKFYYIDSPTRQIVEYDFEEVAGTISNKRIAFDLQTYNLSGVPDGMTIDAKDNLYVALYNGGAVIKIDPRKGTLLQKIAIPAKQVTSVMFGGRDLNILFVTTSRYNLTTQQLGEQPAAGSIFAITGLASPGRRTFYANF